MEEYLNIAGRIVTILPLFLFVMLKLGKRSIAEMPIFDFLVLIVLGAVVGADIAEPKVPHLHTAFAVVAIVLFQYLIALLVIKWRTFGRLVTFEPTVVVRDGVLLAKNMRRIRYSIDNVLQMLRERDVFDLQDVELAIVEANGKLTVQKKPGREPATRDDLNLPQGKSTLAFPLILEGKVHAQVLDSLGLDESWLHNHLRKKGIDHLNNVFYASINLQKEIHISLQEVTGSPFPPLMH